MKLRYLFLLAFLSINLLYAQKPKRIIGQITVLDATVNNVLVLNLNTAQETYTDSVGKFEIEVQLGDLLIFQANHLDKMRKIIDEEAFTNLRIQIPMTSKIEELEEVTIFNYSRINAFDLGITRTKINSLTPAERGKYRNEPNAVEIEQKMMLIEKLENTYDAAFFEELSIPKEKIKSFLYFAVENSEFKITAEGENPARTRLFLTILATEYNIRQK